MKKMLIAIAVLALACAPALALAAPITTGAVAPPTPPKDPGPVYVAPPPGTQVGGDNFGSATVIPSLPYSDTGNTCGFVDDYDPTCTTYNPLAPDVVYAFTPPRDMCVNVSLCGSSYDTVLYIINGVSGAVLGCNDDSCGLQSELNSLNLIGGVVYYIVVDGYSANCGAYAIAVSECPPPCERVCPPGAFVENEPDCYDGYVDAYNGGCNSATPVFNDVLCNDTGVYICGHYGNYISVDGYSSRDTDWYRIVIDHTVTLNLCACAEGHFQILIIDGNHGCPVTSTDILASASTLNANEEICASATLSPGTYYLWAGGADFTGVACGARYVLTVTGYECPPVGVEPAQWGTIKSLYR